MNKHTSIQALLSITISLFYFFLSGPSQAQNKILEKTNKHTDSTQNSHTGKSTININTVEHIFFHPLIVYPELAFKKDKFDTYMQNWFITLTEARSFFYQLYERGYMLVSLFDLYTLEADKTIKKNTIELPKGKKPLIISIDDLNYYPTMQTHGVTKKLLLQEDTLVSLISTPTGEKILKESELVNFLDKFIQEYPDFSYKGARGIIALTGYRGVFGYSTHQTKDKNYKTEVESAIKIANYLKNHGWQFASHGYAHLNEPLLNITTLNDDIKKWEKTVEPIVGKTNIHIFPFGAPVQKGSPHFKNLKQAGFYYFFGVNSVSRWHIQEGTVWGSRIPIDGKYLTGEIYGSKKSPFCVIKKTVDPLRQKAPTPYTRISSSY